MAQFLMYEVWGGLVFNIPALALSLYVGWKLSNGIIKGRELDKKYTKPLAIIFAVVIFASLNSLVIK